MNAIVCLTRGYNDREQYYNLIKRNKQISKLLGKKTPLIIFHEGNISTSDMEYIESKTPELFIQFVLFNEFCKEAPYESMCRFYSYYVWEYCKEYEYIMRIDEDCHLITCAGIEAYEDIMRQQGFVYLKSKYWAESHSETNATLPFAIKELVDKLLFEPRKIEDFYNDKFPYTNVSISSVKFWRTLGMTEILKELAVSDAQRNNRWGDLPLLGSLLNIFAKEKVGTMFGLSYSHLSHGNIIEAEE